MFRMDNKNGDFLPQEFKFSHEFSFYLHDILAESIVYGEEKKIFDVSIEFEDPKQGFAFEELEGGEILDWLEANEYNEVLGELLVKTLYPALLSDFCHFIYEALDCSNKAKLTVAYALLRKPLRENLFFLEWLLANPEEFLNSFYYGPPSSIEPKRGLTLNIIEIATKRTVNAGVIKPDFLYALRYNQNANYGFEPMWNKAVHLITTRKQWATEQQNFNFIFTNDEDRWWQWHQIYTLLPLLLFHTVEVCESLMYLILQAPVPDNEIKIIHRSLGLLAWQGELINLEMKDENLKEWNIEGRSIGVDCVRCSRTIPITESDYFKDLFVNQEGRCPLCNSKNNLEDFVSSKEA